MNMPKPNVQSVPTADVLINYGSTGPIQTESYPIHPQLYDPEDYMITIKKSLLLKICKKVKSASVFPFSWDELSLALFSISSSISIAAFFSPLELHESRRIILFTGLPIVAAGALVFTIMYKFQVFKSRKDSMQDVLAELEPIVNSCVSGRKEDGN